MRLSLCLFAFCVFGLQAQSPKTFYFDTDIDTLARNESARLESFVRENPGIVVYRIDAFCDERGSVGYNDALALRRAEHLRNVLSRNNVALVDSLLLHAIGERFKQEQHLARNRKAEVHYTTPPVQEEKPVSALERQFSKAVKGDLVTLPDLHFYNMSATMVPASRPVVQELLRIMIQRPGLRIEIQGHICCQLKEDADLSRISEYRAKAVYEYLRRGGISEDRMAYKGYGISNPLFPIPEKNEAERSANRRVQVKIVSND